MDTIYTPTRAELDLANDWHGGSASMLYAVSSTGALSTGTESYRAGRTDDEWGADLLDKLADEVADVRQDCHARTYDGADRDRETAAAWLDKLHALIAEAGR